MGAGRYTYSVASEWENRPVNYVSWGNAARFANWMTTGQTEIGLYTLNGAMTDAALMAVTRNAGAGWVLPTEDEWHKSAYYDPKKPGGAGYWDYATGTDTVPSNVLGNPDPGNTATFASGPPGSGTGLNPGPPYYRTEVGAHANSGESLWHVRPERKCI